MADASEVSQQQSLKIGDTVLLFVREQFGYVYSELTRFTNGTINFYLWYKFIPLHSSAHKYVSVYKVEPNAEKDPNFSNIARKYMCIHQLAKKLCHICLSQMPRSKWLYPTSMRHSNSLCNASKSKHGTYSKSKQGACSNITSLLLSFDCVIIQSKHQIRRTQGRKIGFCKGVTPIHSIPTLSTLYFFTNWSLHNTFLVFQNF